MHRNLTAESLAEMLSTVRVASGVTQRSMGQYIGVGERTIKNWEAGSSQPNCIQLLDWFRACGINPVRSVLDWLNPSVFGNLTPSDDVSNIRSALVTYLTDVATDAEVRQLAFCILGNHGSSWRSQLNMLCAHDHTSMRSRVVVARSILDNYEMEQSALVCPDNILPDLDLLRDSVENGKSAAISGKSGYSEV